MSWWRDLLGFGPVEAKAMEPALVRAMIGAGGSFAQIDVNRETALSTPVVLACSRVISEGMAQVSWRLMRRRADGGRDEVYDHPLSAIASTAPNYWQTSFEFRETLGIHAALMGNAYSLIVRDSGGRVQELLPFAPDMVTPEQSPDWTMRYRVRKPDGGAFMVGGPDMWHFRGPSWNSFSGMSAIHLARNAIGLAIAAERFGSNFFGNGARPSGIIRPKGDTTLSPEQATASKQAWMEAHGGENQLGVAFLNGLEYQAISTLPEDAQFIETRAAQVIEICRAFRVNPVMVMQQDKAATYASSEQMFLAHLVHTLGPWFARFVQSADRALLTSAERTAGFHFMLDDKGLMRGSAKERAEYHALALQHAWESVDEVRVIEGLTPLGGEFAVPHRAANLYAPEAPAATE